MALQLRDVHRALGRTIDFDGTPLARKLRDTYRNYNAVYFSGKLDEDGCVLLTNPSSPRALGDYASKDEHGISSRIRIRPSVAKRGELFLLDVLLHEMVHAWCTETIGPDTDKGYKGHGPAFCAKANEIGETLGLPEVFVKGRGGPDCAKWPMVVRPDDYYPPQPRKKSKPKPKTEPEEPRERCAPDPLGDALEALERLREVHPSFDDFRDTMRQILDQIQEQET